MINLSYLLQSIATKYFLTLHSWLIANLNTLNKSRIYKRDKGSGNSWRGEIKREREIVERDNIPI